MNDVERRWNQEDGHLKNPLYPLSESSVTSLVKKDLRNNAYDILKRFYNGKLWLSLYQNSHYIIA